MTRERQSEPRLYDLDQVEATLDATLASRKRPLDALIRALRPKIKACLAEGYTIKDVVEMLRRAGVEGSDRQIRYALRNAGITGVTAATARAFGHATAGRSGARKAGKATAHAGQGGSKDGRAENEEKGIDGQEQDEAGDGTGTQLEQAVVSDENESGTTADGSGTDGTAAEDKLSEDKDGGAGSPPDKMDAYNRLKQMRGEV